MASKRGSDGTKCKRCGYLMQRDAQRCPSCNQWVYTATADESENEEGHEADGTVLLTKVKEKFIPRYVTGLIDDNLGGGIPHDAVILLGGKAGAGKSTIALQLADGVATSGSSEVLYVAAEESGSQIRDRAMRLNLKSPNLVRLNPMNADNDLGEVIRARKPKIVVVDSLPKFTDSPEEAVSLCDTLKKEFAVKFSIPFIVIDHVNKEGDFAGFESLQHAVDTLITIFPTGQGELRSVFTLKNRYGAANIERFLEMTATGLVTALPPEEDDENDE